MTRYSEISPARIDHINTALMLCAAALTYLIPFELLIISYAFLGPAHYLTQIAWMHERNYFLPRRNHALFLAIGTVLMLYFLVNLSLLMVWALLTWAAIWTLANTPKKKIKFAAIFFGVFISLMNQDIFQKFLIVLLPTIIHVYIFTLAFILLGYLKSNRLSAAFSFWTLLAIPVFFFAFPTQVTFSSAAPYFIEGNTFFEHARLSLQKFLNLGDAQKPIVMLFSFAYTYHYLNWFSKVDLIGWKNINIEKKYFIIFIYKIIILCYFYDFSFGFSIASALSALHVTLEFPLNFRTFHAIGIELGKRSRLLKTRT